MVKPFIYSSFPGFDNLNPLFIWLNHLLQVEKKLVRPRLIDRPDRPFDKQVIYLCVMQAY